MSTEKLGVLQLEMKVNATDRQLLENLRYAKSLELPKLRMAETNTRTLAICGSGPSLKDTYKLIPPECEVLALNGAYRFLLDAGLVPKYFAMLDSRSVNVNFLGSIDRLTTFLLASQCHPHCFDALRGCTLGVFHLGTPTTRQIFPEEQVYVGGGGTIGMTAMAIAIALGYRHVILYGYDSSFEVNDRHVRFQPQNSNETTLPVYVEDRLYETTHAMAAQTMDFFPFYSAIKAAFPDFTIDLVGRGLFYDFITTNNNSPSRERELGKYAQAYQMDDYGMSKERYDGIELLLQNIPPTSYLDVSTGRGESLEIAARLGFQLGKGTETVDALCDSIKVVKAVLPNLPFQDKEFDTVSLFEVIEHLLPEDLEPALHELTRVAGNHILISAAVRDCWIGGVNLHPSAMPEEQWEELFRKVWGGKVYRVGHLGGSPAWRVDL